MLCAEEAEYILGCLPYDGVRFVGEQNVLQPKPQSGKLTELIILGDATESCHPTSTM
jgi:hypothetical protein